MKALFASRKFWAALISTVVVVAAHFGLDLDGGALMAIAGGFVAYIAGTAWEDAADKRNGVSPGKGVMRSNDRKNSTQLPK